MPAIQKTNVDSCATNLGKVSCETFNRNFCET